MTEGEPDRKRSLGMLRLDSFCVTLSFTPILCPSLTHSRPKKNGMPAAREGALME